MHCPAGCHNGVCILPKTVALYIEGALIGPADANGNVWDGMGTVSQSTIQSAISMAMALTGVGFGVPGVDAILGWLAKGLLDQYSPPDPKGWAWFMLDGTWSDILIELPEVSNSYFPQWFNRGWLNLPFRKELKIRVELVDVDLMFDDPIGNAIISYPSIEAAFFSGQKFTVPVADQTLGTILALIISVHPMEVPPIPPPTKYFSKQEHSLSSTPEDDELSDCLLLLDCMQTCGDCQQCQEQCWEDLCVQAIAHMEELLDCLFEGCVETQDYCLEYAPFLCPDQYEKCMDARR